MVFFCTLYCYGLDLRTGIYSDYQFLIPTGIRMALGRWHHLHHWRYYLCIEATDFQCKTQELRFPRNLPFVRYGRKHLSLYHDVLFRGKNADFIIHVSVGFDTVVSEPLFLYGKVFLFLLPVALPPASSHALQGKLTSPESFLP